MFGRAAGKGQVPSLIGSVRECAPSGVAILCLVLHGGGGRPTLRHQVPRGQEAGWDRVAATAVLRDCPLAPTGGRGADLSHMTSGTTGSEISTHWLQTRWGLPDAPSRAWIAAISFGKRCGRITEASVLNSGASPRRLDGALDRTGLSRSREAHVARSMHSYRPPPFMRTLLAWPRAASPGARCGASVGINT